MPTSPAFGGVQTGVLLLLVSSLFLLISFHRGVSKLGHGTIVDQNLEWTVGPKYESLPELLDTKLNHNYSASLLKRDATADYETSLCTGAQMWAKIQAAFDDSSRVSLQTLPSTALENGWTPNTLHIALDAPWREYIDHELGPGKVPPVDQAPFIEHTQNLDFTNKQGGHREALSKTGLEAARYRTYYIPTISAVVVKNMRSPATVVKEIFHKSGQPKPPSNALISNVYTPPLSRWSDVTWTVYQSLATGDGKMLQFIGHDQVNNAVSARVMVYIIRKHQPQGNPNARPSLPFPGFEFGIETPEGQALLGTPNGMGTAWLLHDRGTELGRRSLKVRIWIEGRDKLMMAFNMVPV
ncbi:MAG: hypothetical protein Q9177_001891 [Variospora cf. flavescens]